MKLITVNAINVLCWVYLISFCGASVEDFFIQVKPGEVDLVVLMERYEHW